MILLLLLLLRNADPMGFDPMICGSEDRRDILATLRALSGFFGSTTIYQLNCHLSLTIDRYTFVRQPPAEQYITTTATIQSN
jgi:hypothetical protein